MSGGTKYSAIKKARVRIRHKSEERTEGKQTKQKEERDVKENEEENIANPLRILDESEMSSRFGSQIRSSVIEHIKSPSVSLWSVHRIRLGRIHVRLVDC